MTYRYVKNKGEHIRIPACVLSEGDFCLTCFWTPKCTNVLDTFIKKDLIIILKVLHVKNIHCIIVICTSTKAEIDNTESCTSSIIE